MTVTVGQVLSAVDQAMTVVKQVADTPGVNALPYVSLVSSAIGAIQFAEAAGKNVAPYVQALSDTFSGGVPSQEKMDALDAKIKELDAKVDAPLPDKDPDEPD